MIVYMKLRCKGKWGAIAQWVVSYSKKTLDINSEHITVFLPRLLMGVERRKKYDWNKAFSHAISHEYLHRLAFIYGGGWKATTGIDNIVSKGQLPREELLIGDGL